MVFAVFLFLTTSQVQIHAQTPTPTPESDEVRALRDKKTQAELERDIAVAEKAKLDASFPKPTTSPLAGETKVNDGAVIESQMVSYLSMAYAANRMVAQIKEAKTDDGSALHIANLAIYNKADIDLLLNYKATTAQLKILREEFCNELKQQAPQCSETHKATRLAAPLSIVGSFLGAFVDLTALLRTNVTVQGNTFDISEAALVSEVFRAARAPEGLAGHPHLYYPAAFPPTDPSLQTSALLLILEDLHDLKARVLVDVKKLEETQKGITKTQAEIDNLEALIKAGPDQIKAARAELDRLLTLKQELEQKHQKVPFDKLERIAELQENIPQMQQDLAEAPAKRDQAKANLAQLEQGQDADQIRDLISRMKLVNDRFDQLVASLIKVDSATGINSLTAYIRAENLNAVMKDEKDQRTCWLQLAVVKAGGNNRTKTNLIVDIFTGGNRLSHSGGVIVQYNLFDVTGKSIASDTFTEYTGYIKAGKIKRLENPVTVLDVPKRTPLRP